MTEQAAKLALAADKLKTLSKDELIAELIGALTRVAELSPALVAQREALEELLDLHEGKAAMPMSIERLQECCKILRVALNATPAHGRGEVIRLSWEETALVVAFSMVTESMVAASYWSAATASALFLSAIIIAGSRATGEETER